jgi:hypothetical protein
MALVYVHFRSAAAAAADDAARYIRHHLRCQRSARCIKHRAMRDCTIMRSTAEKLTDAIAKRSGKDYFKTKLRSLEMYGTRLMQVPFC